MGVIKDFFDNIFSNAKARVNDPFFGTFVISWVLWNWHQVALLIWGDEKTSSRISIFKDYIQNGGFSSLSAFFWYPFISTIAYIFLCHGLNIISILFK